MLKGRVVQHEGPLDIAVIAGFRFTVTEPHAGGMERHTDLLARQLVDVGHRVTVYAGHGSAPMSTPYELVAISTTTFEPSPGARRDVSMPPEMFMAEHDAYLRLCHRLRNSRHDVVHNNSLHYLPVISELGRPVLHTLHTPPTPWLESAYSIVHDRRLGDGMARSVVSVSACNAAAWRHTIDGVVHNGIEPERWTFGPGGADAAWIGRIVPEKGTHHAIEAARLAGMRLRFAGPIHDHDYFHGTIAPLLSPEVEYLGHLDVNGAAALLGRSAVCFVTPRWEEPFGLVAIEALACGTPVVGYDRGALCEIIDDHVGCLVPGDDIDQLARAALIAATLDRSTCRTTVLRRFSAATMTSAYVERYRSLFTQD